MTSETQRRSHRSDLLRNHVSPRNISRSIPGVISTRIGGLFAGGSPLSTCIRLGSGAPGRSGKSCTLVPAECVSSPRSVTLACRVQFASWQLPGLRLLVHVRIEVQLASLRQLQTTSVLTTLLIDAA